MTVSSIQIDDSCVFHAFLHDISERKRAEERLRLNAAIVHNMSEGVALVQASTETIVYTNSTFDSMFGYEQSELLERPISLVHGSDRKTTELVDVIRQSLKKKGTWSGELVAIKKNGVLFWCSTNISNLRSDSLRSDDVWIAVYSDISLRKAAEENLLQSTEKLRRSNAELEEFAYIASHDLQEPLRKITNYAGLFAESYLGKLDENAQKYLGYIVDGTKRMRILIEDLLAFSRLGSQKICFEEIDLGVLVNEVVNDFSQSIAEVKAEISVTSLPVIRGNRMEIAQLFSNLLSNAIKFRSADVLRIEIGSSTEENEHHIWVADNGIGIEKEYQKQIFGLFRRLHSMAQYTGTGIGLSICKKVAENHGGRIWVESEFGQGSTFHFTLSTRPGEENGSGSQSR